MPSSNSSLSAIGSAYCHLAARIRCQSRSEARSWEAMTTEPAVAAAVLSSLLPLVRLRRAVREPRAIPRPGAILCMADRLDFGISPSASAAPATAVTAAPAEDKDANWIEEGRISPYQSIRSRLIYPTSTSATAITTIAATRCHYWSRRLFTGFPSAAFIASGSRDPFRLRQSPPPERRSPPDFYILWNRRALLYFGGDGRWSSDVTCSSLAASQATAATCESDAEFVHYPSCYALAICHVRYTQRSSCDSRKCEVRLGSCLRSDLAKLRAQSSSVAVD